MVLRRTKIPVDDEGYQRLRIRSTLLWTGGAVAIAAATVGACMIFNISPSGRPQLWLAVALFGIATPPIYVFLAGVLGRGSLMVICIPLALAVTYVLCFVGGARAAGLGLIPFEFLFAAFFWLSGLLGGWLGAGVSKKR